MKNFAAIDFETANNCRTSVCSVGIVVMRNGIITDCIYELIRPVPNYYGYWNTKIHGLRYEDTANSALFPEVWEKIKPVIAGLPLVAHNSPFDEGCLRYVHEHYGIEYPDYKFYCTCRIARKLFPKLLNHRLETVAKYVGYNLTNHHHALDDARACAHIASHLLT